MITFRNYEISYKTNNLNYNSYSLIGMGATVLNGAKIGTGSLIGASALVSEGKDIPDRVLVMGAPGRVVREIDEAQYQGLLDSAARYQANRARFRAGLKRLD